MVVAALPVIAGIAGALGINLPNITDIIKLLSTGDKKKTAAALLRLEEINIIEAFEDVPELLEREDVSTELKGVFRGLMKQQRRTARVMDTAADILVGDDDKPNRSDNR